jgi:hypothetical protein
MHDSSSSVMYDCAAVLSRADRRFKNSVGYFSSPDKLINTFPDMEFTNYPCAVSSPRKGDACLFIAKRIGRQPT